VKKIQQREVLDVVGFGGSCSATAVVIPAELLHDIESEGVMLPKVDSWEFIV